MGICSESAVYQIFNSPLFFNKYFPLVDFGTTKYDTVDSIYDNATKYLKNKPETNFKLK